MAPLRPEEITLPARFLSLTAHLATVLTVFFDIDNVVSRMLQVDPNTSTNQSQIKEWNNTKKTLQGLIYGSYACFGIEYVTLFLGISMFFPAVMSFNVLLHFTGFILTCLFIDDAWNLDSFIAFFAIFVAFPTVIELLTFVFVTKFSFLKF